MKILAIIGIIIVSVLILILLAYIIFYTRRKIIAKNRIENLFETILNEHKNQVNKLIKSNNKCYDYYLETLTNIYYIKVIYNFSNYEISINSEFSWQYIKDANDTKIHFIEDIFDFVTFKASDPKKTVTKLCLIYPNSRSLLYYINESDIAFVRPEEALYGINFITYERLNSNHNYI